MWLVKEIRVRSVSTHSTWTELIGTTGRDAMKALLDLFKQVQQPEVFWTANQDRSGLAGQDPFRGSFGRSEEA